MAEPPRKLAKASLKLVPVRFVKIELVNSQFTVYAPTNRQHAMYDAHFKSVRMFQSLLCTVVGQLPIRFAIKMVYH